MLANPLEDDRVRIKVLDLVHRTVIGLGTLAIVMGLSRVVLGTGDWRASATPIVLVVVVAVSWILRDRVPTGLRAGIVLGSLLATACGALLFNGITAPSGILLMVVVVLGWLVLPGWALLAAMGTEGALFAAVAWWNIHHPLSFLSNLETLNRSPVVWTNVGVMYVLSGLITLAAVRVLVRELHDRMLRISGSEARLGAILAGVHDAVFIQDLSDGRILEIHGRCEEMYGAGADVLRGMTVEQLSAGAPPWTQVEARGWMERAQREGPQSFPWKARHLSGTEFWVEVSMRIFPLDGIDRLVVTVTDIDQSMKDRERLRSFNTALEARVQERTAQIRKEREAMEEFSYMVSHDLRAPLRGIDGFARVLEEDFGTALLESGREMTTRIRRGAARMGRLIDAFLSLSRVDRIPVKTEEVDLGVLAAEVVDEIRQAASGSGGKPVDWRIGSLPSVHSDPDLVRQVLANLAANAAKFSGLVESPIVRIDRIRRGEFDWIEVVDNGPGFDASQSEKLFKAFSRLHGDSVEGIGIGLATVKRIVERLGGAVEAEGRPGKGATFRFRLGATVPGDRTGTELPVRS
jgi:PAS domain S-box-containing protein